MKKQAGYTIIMAAFVLVVVGLLGTYMVRLGGVQRNTANFALQGARAYQAARAGIDWSIATINGGGTCSQITPQTAMTFTGLNGFSVALTCTSQTVYEANNSPTFFTITATSTYDVFTASDYVSRTLTINLIH